MHGSVRPHCFSDSVDDIGVASVAAEFAVRSRIAACDRSAGQNGLLTSGAAALGQPAFASSIIATPDVIFPDVQNPHWKPSCSTNACRPAPILDGGDPLALLHHRQGHARANCQMVASRRFLASPRSVHRSTRQSPL